MAVALALATFEAPAHADDIEKCAQAAEAGEARMKEGRFVEARVELATCVRATCPAVVASACGRWLDEIQRTLPSVVIGVVDGEGHDLVDAQVSIDGHAVPASGKATEVDPGTHEIVAVAPSGERASQTVAVRAGEKLRSVRVVLARRPARVEPTKPAILAPLPAEPVEEGAKPGRTIGLGLIGLGSVSLLLSGTLGVISAVEYGDLKDSCASGRCPQDTKDAGSTRNLVADVALGVGVVALAAGIYLFVTNPRSAGH